jgi:hypothetical protein
LGDCLGRRRRGIREEVEILSALKEAYIIWIAVVGVKNCRIATLMCV